MPHAPPPAAPPGTPVKATLPAGTPLFRVHRAEWAATAFNPVPADRLWGGGRFDATPDDPYRFLYAGATAAAAVCESFLRSVPHTGPGPRVVPRAAVRGRRLAFLRLAVDVDVVSLMSGRDLAAVAQDSWLVQAEAHEYAFTRAWGHWIRRHTDPWARGFVWPSKREPADRVAVLFGDRCPPGVVEETGTPAVDLAGRDGEEWLNGLLAPYQARVGGPR
ncbi:RES family NAD+ phosphorylase [Streptomyces sp. DH12]|uniref:RES family NAD+ phosphorylase n=1 Tax=Streptomyces sp. DH12 TaxID=2857010 RepID=UPI001E5BE12E|nr:RES family NAD+ phosphorylase [Streptomyces sp. DH12]